MQQEPEDCANQLTAQNVSATGARPTRCTSVHPEASNSSPLVSAPTSITAWTKNSDTPWIRSRRAACDPSGNGVAAAGLSPFWPGFTSGGINPGSAPGASLSSPFSPAASSSLMAFSAIGCGVSGSAATSSEDPDTNMKFHPTPESIRAAPKCQRPTPLRATAECVIISTQPMSLSPQTTSQEKNPEFTRTLPEGPQNHTQRQIAKGTDITAGSPAPRSLF